jgi:hypothetical protein
MNMRGASAFRKFILVGCVASMSSFAQAQSRFESLGQNNNSEALFIDTKTIRNVEYPKAIGGIITPDSKATYRETWIKAVNNAGETIGQYLWLFDCKGSSAEMAVAATVNSSDRTNYAKTAGVDQLLRRIPPDSFFENVQTRICKK